MAPVAVNVADEEAFAWLRERAPSARTITVRRDALSDAQVIVLEGATEEDRRRVEKSLWLRFPWGGWDVRAPEVIENERAPARRPSDDFEGCTE